MNLQQLIEKFDFLKILSIESKQCIKYIVNFSNSNSICIKELTKKVCSFPTNGSNSYLGNYYSFQDPGTIWKIYRLQLCDYSELKEDDIELRTDEIFKSITEFLKTKNIEN